ncbi:MAG: AMP-binding protein, partial [Acidimicrobiia bacterium]|nr:AMP-binding protein [Acidimicrobiia bacterium]
PGHPAVIETDGTVVSYADLWNASGEVADRLRIADGEVVGVSMLRGAAVVTAMLSVLRAGGVYCPTRPDDPPAHTRRLHDRAGIRVVLREDDRGAIVADDRGGDGRVLDCDEPPVYVMWTSGSTGEPKAVVIPHRGVVRLVRDRTLAHLRPDDRVAFASNPMFDAATWEVWATLGNGATIVVVDPDDLVDAGRLRTHFARTGVTRAFLSTSLFDLHAGRDPSMFGGLRTLIVGGEPLRPRTIGAVLTSTSPPGSLVNGYGPTECTTFATGHRITVDDLHGARIPIGTPLSDTLVAIVDDRGRAVPDGEVGELWLAGGGVALGHLGPGGLEQDRFIDAAVDDDVPRRWYRSGDIARLDAQGRLDCLGRLDRQVKIRGYRVEPDEIEQVIASCEGVAEVAVIADRSSDSVRLCAFVVAAQGRAGAVEGTVDGIRRRLRAELPTYMIPTRISVVDGLPLTPNGKLDSATLLALPSRSRSGAVSVESGAPDPLVTAVIDRARVVLNQPTLGRDDDLWDAGLDSLSAIELAAAVSEVVDREIHPTDFIDHPTPSAIAGADADDRGRSAGVTDFDPSSTTDPIFVVLGRGTSPLAFRHMAHELAASDRRLVVLEAEVLRSKETGRGRVEAMAASIAAEIDRRQPDRPVLLAGWSAGGVIAAHATWLLEQGGRDVRLMLFDTIFFVRGRRAGARAAIAILTHVLRRLRDGVSRSNTPDEHGIRRTGQARLFVDQMRELQAYGAPPAISAPVANFHVTGSVAATVVTSVLPGSTAIEVGGDHNSMFDREHVASLTTRMNDWIRWTGPTGRESVNGDPRRRR